MSSMIHFEHSLKKYIRSAYLPDWRAFPLDDMHTGFRILKNGAARPWPSYASHEEFSGTCTLEVVRCFSTLELGRIVADYMLRFPDHIIHGMALAYTGVLRLPNDTLIDISDRDRRQLARGARTKEDVAWLVNDFVLGTICGVIHTMEAGLLQAHHTSVCATGFESLANIAGKHTKWHILHLPGDEDGTSSMLVVVIPPWWFGPTDFDRFTCMSEVPLGELDALAAGPNSHIIWALLMQLCKTRKCHYFAVTTYYNWVLGSLSTNRVVARVTPQIHAPVCLKERGETTASYIYYQQPELAGSSKAGFCELVLYWIQASRGLAPSCLPSDVVPMPLPGRGICGVKNYRPAGSAGDDAMLDGDNDGVNDGEEDFVQEDGVVTLYDESATSDVDTVVDSVENYR